MGMGVAVLIPTYNRLDIILETIYRLKWNLKVAIPLHIFIGVDGADGTYEAALNLAKYNKVMFSITPIKGPRMLMGSNTGLGANLNLLIDAASYSYDLLMQMDDDHWLNGELDLTQHIKVLQKVPDIGWIRLMGVSYHKLKAEIIPEIEHQVTCGRYWQVDWTSPELYIPSNRPHIKRYDWHTYYGMYTSGLSLGETEDKFCWQCKEKALRDGGPKVAIPVSLNEEIWLHVGNSWQGKGE